MNFKRKRGGVLLATLVFVTILSVAASSILALSLYSHRLALRNDLRAQAKAVAETEMDWIFYQFMNLILGGTNPPDTAALLAANLPCDTGPQGTTVVPTTDRSPYLEAHRTAGWIVRRSVVWNRTITGQIPSTQKRGTITYIDVRVEVLPPATSSYAGTTLERVGRYFSSSRTSIFQYAIFYQGDLEMAPGGSMTINGDISANGSIYMGAGKDQLGVYGVLQLNNMVRYLAGDYFNKDALGNTVYRKPGTPTGGTLVPPVFGTDEASQVQTMTSQRICWAASMPPPSRPSDPTCSQR
jgi:type II secretory pathway pseudopilin PulG